MDKIYILGTLIFLAIIMAMVSVQTQVVSPQVQGLVYNSEVCTSYRRTGELEWIQLGCSHNTLTTAGKNAIKEYLGSAGAAAFRYIALANNTPEANHAVGDTDLDNRTACCGLEITDGAGTYASIGTGNWTISQVFTCDTEAVANVNATGLFNATTPGTFLAYNTFAEVDLQINDQINVTWTIWVT